MPRDWKNDPEAIRRYCTCGYAINIHNGVPDEASRALTWRDPECPLHSPDERFDLPPEFP